MNHELHSLCDDVEVVQRIKMKRMNWLGHVVRMNENAPARAIYSNLIHFLFNLNSILQSF